MTKKRKIGRPSLNYRFDKIEPGKRKSITSHNPKSCQNLAHQYARKNGLVCDTKIIDDKVSILYTQPE
ncbi:hypothetical protein [Spirosoma sp. KUDC1026]|uniref:hypothetical protein n=1 Tax=Spirosoma sp. KUDC1026 TaxID=2745947 RepID=UPI00159BEF3B|nr:hypothetical protein [Spirosoma sp. KUDC1026]QKZ15903.1 hypothetical protein HU175_24610 [Spirosoma sp. KUDC1026]